jgi:hypothetical protein
MRSTFTVLALFLVIRAIGQNTFPSSGNVGIGTTSPVYSLDVVAPASTWKAQFRGPDGYILIGPANSSWANIYTDRPNFIFNQGIWSLPGTFSSYAPSDLTLQTNGTGRLTISNSTGYVGIGTASPGVKLDIVGSGSSNVDLAVNGRIKTGDGSNYGGIWIGQGSSNLFVGQSNATSLGFYNNGAWRLIADNTGKVGIGTTTPDQLLTVKGIIHSQEVRVDLSVPGPDYVFEKNYKLPTLEEIKSYVDQNKHLPDVPTAAEMEKNGIQLGEMNMLLLKKVEELTLYVIEQNKKIELQQQQNQDRQKQIDKLSELIKK